MQSTCNPILEVDDEGTKRWKVNGVPHREGGPAIEKADGTKHWFHHGQHHRVNGPAIENADGTKEWYRHNQLHREDGPAVEWPGRRKSWWCHGQRHRKDGPAIEYQSGAREWWLHGQEYTRPEWLREVLKDHPLTPHQRELLLALSENWEGTPNLLYETVTHLAPADPSR